jgi:hypothetical protein
VARPEDGPNERVTVEPGWAASKSFAIVVNDSVSEAAARTVIEPVAPAAVVDDVAADVSDELADDVVDVEPVELVCPLLPPQPASSAKLATE